MILKGLDGSNPLGFLAALGTMRTSSKLWPETKMYWEMVENSWTPVLVLDDHITQSELAARFSGSLKKMKDHSAFSFSDNLSVPLDDYRRVATDASKKASHLDRDYSDFVVAFGSESVESDKPGQIADTALRTMSGSGHQHFLGTIRRLISDTDDSHIEKALFSPWSYEDPLEKHTMRWDPRDDVRRALRWDEPSGDPARKTQGSVWGANRLAVEALPLLPTAPVRNHLETTGFVRRRGEGMFWTWPIWEVKITINVVRSLLSMAELQYERPDRNALAARGVCDVYRCQRLTMGRYRNFSPARSV